MSTDRDLWPLYEYQPLVICNTAFSLRSPGSAHQWVQRSQWWQRAPHCESVAHLTKTTAADLLTNFQEQNWGSGLRLRKQRQGHQMTFEITLSFHPFQMHGEGKLGETYPVFLAMESCLTLAETNIYSSLHNITMHSPNSSNFPFERLKRENDLDLILWFKMKWPSHFYLISLTLFNWDFKQISMHIILRVLLQL